MYGSNLIKVGGLAKQAGVLPSTIQFYVKIGLLQPLDHTPGGYHLFDESEALERVRVVQHFRAKERLTLAEIRQRLLQDDKLGCLDNGRAPSRRKPVPEVRWRPGER